MDVGFNKYWEEKIKYDEEHKPNMVTVNPSNSPMLNKSVLFKNIEDRDSMTDAELRYFIENNFLSIMNNVFNRNIYVKYIKAFEEPRFLEAFIDVLQNIRYYDSDIIIKCNLLAYHYITRDERQKDHSVVNLMMRMSKTVNRNSAIRLKKFNMPENLENVLLLARYSDFDIGVSVKRTNLMIVSSPILYNLLDMGDYVSDSSVEFLAKLLVELYPTNQWIYVLPYFMMDVLPDYDERNPQTIWITPEVESMDSALNLAVLKVLDEMLDDSFMLRRVLTSYTEGYMILHRNHPTRFSFRSISHEYERLSNNLIYLREEEGIYVP